MARLPVFLTASGISENNSDDLPGFGAGIYVDGSELQIEDSWIEWNNSSSGSGGGIYMTNNSEAYFVETNVRNNNALKQGGGIFINNGSNLFADGDIRVANNTSS